MMWRQGLPWWGVGVVGGIGLAAFDRPASWGWLAYAGLGLLAAEGARRLWRAVVDATPATGLMAALVVGLALRLVLGMSWTALLPQYGNDVPPHHAGVFFPDAFERDRSAHALGRSEESLFGAFDIGKGDQYGTLLFGTAVLYRVFGPEVQATAVPAAVAAYFGALAIVLTWAFARRTFGAVVAGIAAWVVALYPEAVLLGSQSMREPYVMAGLAAALYGYALAREGRSRTSAGWIAAGCLLCLLISPPFALLAVLIVGVGWLWEGRVQGLAARLATGVLAVIFVVALVLTVRAWSSLLGGSPAPLDAISRWLTGGGYELQALLSASGFAEQIFRQAPAWSHVPLMTLNGLIQPLLPAAVMDNTGVLLMQVVMIWRSLGWFVVLPVLLYSPAAAVRREGWRSLASYLAFVVILTAILISYRFAGDQWDSPRYRAALAPALATLIGWAWVTSRERRDRWLVWLSVLVGIETLVIGWWYAGRYYHIPRLSLYPTLLVAAIAGIALVVVATVVERVRRRT